MSVRQPTGTHRNYKQRAPEGQSQADSDKEVSLSLPEATTYDLEFIPWASHGRDVLKCLVGRSSSKQEHSRAKAMFLRLQKP